MGADRYTLRAGTAEDYDEIYRVVGMAFNDDPDDAERAAEQLVYEPERAILVSAGTAIVGVAGAYTRELAVPGAVLPAAHVTMVGVDPVHRRQGVLTRMMHHQLADIRARGEAVAILWASEGTIYQRYGYGMAARRQSFEIEREARLREPVPPGGLRAAAPTEVVGDLQKVYDQVRVERTGWSSREGIWWEHLLADIPKRRQGASALRAVLHEGVSGVDGYALWRVKSDWGARGPQGTVLVREVVAATVEAYKSLWQHLLTVDLTRETTWWLGALDEPLQYLVNEPRRLGSRIGDSLWVRLVDVPAALAARRYAAPVDVVIEVEDPLIPRNSGTWHLIGDTGSASCRPAERPAELRAEIGALGAAYLGDASLTALAAAGRVHDLGSDRLGPTSIAFGWHRAPSALEIF
jgi:predicted acetyltransferase